MFNLNKIMARITKEPIVFETMMNMFKYMMQFTTEEPVVPSNFVIGTESLTFNISGSSGTITDKFVVVCAYNDLWIEGVKLCRFLNIHFDCEILSKYLSNTSRTTILNLARKMYPDCEKSSIFGVVFPINLAILNITALKELMQYEYNIHISVEKLDIFWSETCNPIYKKYRLEPISLNIIDDLLLMMKPKKNIDNFFYLVAMVWDQSTSTNIVIYQPSDIFKYKFTKLTKNSAITSMNRIQNIQNRSELKNIRYVIIGDTYKIKSYELNYNIWNRFKEENPCMMFGIDFVDESFMEFRILSKNELRIKYRIYQNYVDQFKVNGDKQKQSYNSVMNDFNVMIYKKIRTFINDVEECIKYCLIPDMWYISNIFIQFVIRTTNYHHIHHE